MFARIAFALLLGPSVATPAHASDIAGVSNGQPSGPAWGTDQSRGSQVTPVSVTTRARIAPTLVLLSATLLATACSRTAPIYNVEDRPIPVVTQKLSLDEIGRNIMEAGRRHYWRMDPIEPGLMRATLNYGPREAVINISYTQQSYSITLAESMNLRQEGDEIHKKYNKWIHLLQKDIDERLYRAGLAAK